VLVVEILTYRRQNAVGRQVHTDTRLVQRKYVRLPTMLIKQDEKSQLISTQVSRTR
jgi:hypothetical protein